jgi:hypothetical protein
MALNIVQIPLYNKLPIGQQIIFAVSDPTTVATKYKVKFVAEVHVSTHAINLGVIDDRIGTFKTTPNNEGVGIFDLRPILETFVKPDNEASLGSSYKDTQQRDIDFPMHLIDRFGMSESGIRNFAINFFVEWAEDPTEDIQISTEEPSDVYLMFNGVLQYDDALTLDKGNYGYDLSKFETSFVGDNQQFLSNAPSQQYARLTDYGTLPFFNWHNDVKIDTVTYDFRTIDDVSLGTLNVGNITSTGGRTYYTDNTKVQLMYVAMAPANIRQWDAIVDGYFNTGNVAYYTVILTDADGEVSTSYTVNIICPNLKSYEGIRLTWLNQWGTWDYYTFTMKSTRTTTTKRIPYTQQGGTWNESRFKIKGWKGGKKNFRVNSTEKIKINTDFVTEAEGVWFEELINSQDVYIVNEYVAGDDTATITNKYIEPVTLTTSSYIKKTIANDKLMQYTFEIEKSKMQRTQAV